MPIEMSLNLAGLLHSCSEISELYAKQVDTEEEKVSYKELAEALRTLRMIHTSYRNAVTIEVGVVYASQ